MKNLILLFLSICLFTSNCIAQECEGDVTPIALRTDLVAKDNYFGSAISIAFGMSDVGSFEVGTQISPNNKPFYNAALMFRTSDLWWVGLGGQLQDHVHVYMENRFRLIEIIEDDIVLSVFHRTMHKDNPNFGINVYFRLQ